VNQNLTVKERPIEPARLGRFDHRTHDSLWAVEHRQHRDAVDVRQRENGVVVVVVYRLGFSGVMFQGAVRLEVTMNQRVNVPVFLSFVHVLGRRDGEQSQRNAQHACENPGHFH
jgi:hypothetical protein